MPLGDEELREDDRAGAPGPAAAPGIIEVTVVGEEPGDHKGAYGPGSLAGGASAAVAHVPLWGPPPAGRAVARWQQDPPADGDGDDGDRPAATALEPVPLAPAGDDRRRRTPAVIGVALAGA